jgi:pimeloyl-ACP methyl ester carboxylesterase
VYALSRNGTDQGKTTITVFRRDDSDEIETNESGYAGAVRAQILGAYRYVDLVSTSYVATYRAPFLRTSTLGMAPGKGPRRPFGAPVTLRYRIDGTSAKATLDGVAQSRTWPALPASPKPEAKSRFVFDAPFMSGVMLVPAYRHRSGSAVLAPISDAFDEGIDLAPERIVSTAPHFPKTPKTDAALQLTDVATLWFDRGNYIVHEAHFDRLNLDARLIAYSRTALAADPPPEDPAPTPKPHLESLGLDVSSADGTKIAALLDLPAGEKPRAPAIVFVPPAPNANRNFTDDGPDPIYPHLALAFAQRGYAVVRYDGREAANPGAPLAETWDQSLADVEAAIEAAGQSDAIDPSRIYLLGYGVGADLAMAAAGKTDVSLAGVVALGPTVLGYRDCAKRTNSQLAGAFMKSAAAHDSQALAARAHVPLFVLHSGVPACAETKDEVTAYDDKLHAANGRATIVTAADLSASFGGLYDADSQIDTQEFFPYRFDGSTQGAIGDWLDNPKTSGAAGNGGGLPAASGVKPHAPPPPPPITNSDMNGEMPNPHASPTANQLAPGVVLPSGMTPPPYQVPPEPSPSPSATS